MRQLCVLSAILISATLAACGGGDNPAGDDVVAPDGGLEQPDYGFQIVTPTLTVPAGTETTKCFYTTLDITDDVGVKQWISEMTYGCHHLIVYFTDTALAADGTVDDCQASNSGIPVWTYAAQTEHQQLDMPTDVGITVKAHQHLYVQTHYLNAGLEDLDVHATINGNAYEPGYSYTPAAPYITYNTQIDLDPGETATFGGTCAVPSNAQFFTLSTHAHRRATHTQVQDGTPVVFESDDWEEPGSTDWVDSSYSFSSGNLTYSCTYTNNESFHVGEGQSAETDEMCMAVGYMYPASAPTYCLNSFVVPGF